jgi:alkaline phosphatase D
MNRSKVIGVWDDHDYGRNNGDYAFKWKHQNREVYLDFIGEPQNTIRRLDRTRGIYQDYVIMHDNIKIHVVLLDVRFHYNEDEPKERLGRK